MTVADVPFDLAEAKLGPPSTRPDLEGSVKELEGVKIESGSLATVEDGPEELKSNANEGIGPFIRSG